MDSADAARLTEAVTGAVADAVKRGESYTSKQQNPDLNESINQLIHYGIDLYYLLDQPERLEKAVQAILQACYKAFGTSEEN